MLHARSVSALLYERGPNDYIRNSNVPVILTCEFGAGEFVEDPCMVNIRKRDNLSNIYFSGLDAILELAYKIPPEQFGGLKIVSKQHMLAGIRGENNLMNKIQELETILHKANKLLNEIKVKFSLEFEE